MNRNRKFFLKFGVFIILLIGLNALFSFLYDRGMIYYRLNRNQDHQFEVFSDTLRYLMLGNSHNVVNPMILGNSFSYVTPRELYTQTYFKLKYILEKTNKRPENILLSVDPVNFSPKTENDLTFDGYWKKYINYFELAREYRDPHFLMNWFMGNFCTYAGNFKFIFQSIRYFRFDLDMIKLGYLPRQNFQNFAREPNREGQGLIRATAYLSSYNKKSELGSVRYYCRILDLCRQYNIRPILLRMPQTEEYQKEANKLVNIAKLDREILAFSHLYSSNFILLDYRNEFIDKPEYFFNADHLNPTGATIISNKIRKTLVKLNSSEKLNPNSTK